MKRQLLCVTLISSVGLGGIVGCDDMPGGPREQGAVIGGVAGAAGGAAIAKDNRAVGAVVGGLLGAGGGWLIGQQIDKKNDKDAEKAAEQAREAPATPAQARQSATADLNKDGFVTLDEVVAMRDAGLDDQEQIKRLEATGQVFQLTRSQEDYLMNHGVSRNVVDQLRTMNQPVAQPASSSDQSIGDQTISAPR